MNSQQNGEVFVFKSCSTLTNLLKSVKKCGMFVTEKNAVSNSNKGHLLEQVAIVKTNLKEDILAILEMCPNSRIQRKS
jgi:hypothetical protein